MASIFAGIPVDTIYHNDILVYAAGSVRWSSTTSVSVNKSLALRPLSFSGFRLSACIPEHIHRVTEPTSASFLGMTANYLCFLTQYWFLSTALRYLLKHGQPWLWMYACSNAVHLLKSQLTLPPVLALLLRPGQIHPLPWPLWCCDVPAVMGC